MANFGGPDASSAQLLISALENKRKRKQDEVTTGMQVGSVLGGAVQDIKDRSLREGIGMPGIAEELGIKMPNGEAFTAETLRRVFGGTTEGMQLAASFIRARQEKEKDMRETRDLAEGDSVLSSPWRSVKLNTTKDALIEDLSSGEEMSADVGKQPAKDHVEYKNMLASLERLKRKQK